jgi:hypothetical protein
MGTVPGFTGTIPDWWLPIPALGTGGEYAPAMRRFLGHHMATLAVLLCLQAAATMLAVRRDPVDRFRAACVSALVWESLRRLDRRPPVARLTRAR